MSNCSECCNCCPQGHMMMASAGPPAHGPATLALGFGMVQTTCCPGYGIPHTLKTNFGPITYANNVWQNTHVTLTCNGNGVTDWTLTCDGNSYHALKFPDSTCDPFSLRFEDGTIIVSDDSASFVPAQLSGLYFAQGYEPPAPAISQDAADLPEQVMAISVLAVSGIGVRIVWDDNRCGHILAVGTGSYTLNPAELTVDTCDQVKLLINGAVPPVVVEDGVEILVSGQNPKPCCSQIAKKRVKGISGNVPLMARLVKRGIVFNKEEITRRLAMRHKYLKRNK